MNKRIGRVFRLAAALLSLYLLCACSAEGLSPAVNAGGDAPDARGETGWMRSEMSGGAYTIPEFLKTEFHDEAAVGDLIAVTDAGSYAYSLSPLHFADQEPPRQYLRLEDGSFVDR